MTIDAVELSRTLAHVLRHEPLVYGLEIDAQGWVDLHDVVDSLRRKGGPWREVTATDVRHVVDHGTKPRFEIDGDRIRARYGHSLPGRLDLPAAKPAVELFHGTSPAASELISKKGLLPMNRQFVHLAERRDDALRVGLRKSTTPVILRVDASSAHAAGVVFHRAHDGLWLARAIPAAFITLSVDP